MARAEAWRKAFMALGVKEGEVVPVVGLALMDFLPILGGLIMCNAVPYFLRPINTTAETVGKEVEGLHKAILFDGMWGQDWVREVFDTEQFTTIIFVGLEGCMWGSKKHIVRHSAQKKWDESNIRFPLFGAKYLTADQAIKLGKGNIDPERVHDLDAPCCITSSSGTTAKHGENKGIVHSNREMMACLTEGKAADPEICYPAGGRALNLNSFAISTALVTTCFLPFWLKMIVVIDPLMTIDMFYGAVLRYKPNLCFLTGSMWGFFFRNLKEDIDNGKIPDLSFIVTPMVGGESISPKRLAHWNELMSKCGASRLLGGYSLSECGSVGTIDHDRIPAHNAPTDEAMSVGFFLPGIEIKLLDEDNGEPVAIIPYRRGVLLMKTEAASRRYYHRKELSEEVMLPDNWINTGDIAYVSSDGRVHICGRMTDYIVLGSQKIYLFDISTAIVRNIAPIEECTVLSHGDNRISIHVISSSDYNQQVLAFVNNNYCGADVIGVKSYNYFPASSRSLGKKDIVAMKEYFS